MINISELKEGDFLMVNNEGALMDGCVTAVDHAQKLAKVLTGEDNEFWYDGHSLTAIPLSDQSLQKLNFEKIEEPEGGVKYKKGAFRVHLNRKDDFHDIDFWYREDRRHIKEPLSLHELQNHYLSMTKVHLTDAPI
jgi:hypothetical protein